MNYLYLDGNRTLSELDRLAKLLETQRAFQMRASRHKAAYDIHEPDVLIPEFKDMVMALQDELHEALGEIGWKPWATSRHFNTEAVQGELIDAFCFLMSLMLLAGMDANTIFNKYMLKMTINHNRQDNGYDAVNNKCPFCKRAYDDSTVQCTGPDEDGNYYCASLDNDGNLVGWFTPLTTWLKE